MNQSERELVVLYIYYYYIYIYYIIIILLYYYYYIIIIVLYLGYLSYIILPILHVLGSEIWNNLCRCVGKLTSVEQATIEVTS